MIEEGRAVLRVVEGSRSGYALQLVPGQRIRIGRRAGDLCFEDPLISADHCVLDYRSGQWWVEDLGSTNGTRVNGERVEQAPLTVGASLQIGQHRLTLQPASHDSGVRDASRVTGRGPGCAWLLDEELAGGRDTFNEGEGFEMDPVLTLPFGMSAVLEVVAGVDAGRVFRLVTAKATVGRGEGDIPLEDTEVSRHHAVLEFFGPDMIFLRDLGSTNGTFLNGRSVGLARVEAGDRIGVGTTLLRLETSESGAGSSLH